MKPMWMRLLAILFSFAMIATACGGSDSDGAAVDDVDTAPSDDTAPDTPSDTVDDAMAEDEASADASCDATVPGTQINYGVFAPNRAFDPTVSSGALVGGTEIAAVYDVLFIFNPDTAEIEPHLAESLTPNADFTEWSLKLREGITYSDGTPLTAQMVSDNIDRYFREEGVSNTSAGFLQYIDTKTVTDDLTLDMTLTTPIAEMGLIFADEPGMVVNTNAIGDDLDAFGVMPPDAAGVGPYTVETNVPGEETVLVARDDYWGGPVCIERLRFVFVPGAAATYDAFKNGDLNVGFLRDPVTIATADADGVNSYYFNQDGGLLYALNHRDERLTSDIRLREAIALAIDPSIINNRAFQDKLDASKALFGKNSRFYSDDITPMATDTVRATELVEELKSEGWDGNLQFEVQNSPPGPEAALAVEGMLSAVGITANVSSLPIGENIGKLGAGDFDIIQNGINSGPGTAVLSLVRNLSSTSPTNRIGYSSPEMDELLNEALATPGPDLPSVMARINDQFNADFVGVPIGSTNEGIVWADNISGVVPTVSTIFLFHNAVLEP